MKKYNVKSLIVGGLVGAILTVSTTGYAETVITKVDAYLNPEITVSIDGTQLILEKSVVVIDGSSFLPLKLIGEAFGKTVNWNDKNKTIELTSIIDLSKAIPSNDTATLPTPTPTVTPSPTTTPVNDQVNIGEGIVYYNASEVNSKYKPTSSRVLDNGHVLWTINGKEIDQQEIRTENDIFHIDGTNKQYWSKKYYLHYLSEEQLSEFQKYSVDFNTNIVTPID